jgi:ATP-dependent DNA helicase RecG
VANGCQAAIMTPTEILTEQHLQNIERFLTDSRVRWLLLSGSLSAAERRKALARIRAGDVDIVVGTQALIQQDVTFKRLGFVVVDEQHKFGVLQRAESRWRNAEEDRPLRPHYLVMTATPIPRTLALTVFGDLDISVIDELPPGRRPIRTAWVRPSQRPAMYERIRQEIASGRQAYVVCPLVEESDKQDMKAATEEAERLQKEVFQEFAVALLHGRMDATEKQRVMEAFRSGKAQVLVSTIVIEVGIDIENATVMVIEHAERFGLAQLHQLRGRIGRGRHESTCYLVAQPTTEFAERRIAVMTETNDGFRIAEEDLKLRGPGEFFGTRQHGLPELRVGNLIEDYDLLQLARQEATDLVRQDADLASAGHGAIRAALLATYGRKMELIEVG